MVLILFSISLYTIQSVKDEKTGKHIFFQLELHAAVRKQDERKDVEPVLVHMFRVFSHCGDVADLKVVCYKYLLL